MSTELPKKRAAFGLAALLLACCCHFDTVLAETETETAAEQLAPTQTASEAMTEETQEAATEALSTVTVIHTAEVSEDDYTPTDWWKAELDSYDDDFSLISYRTVQNPDAENAQLVAESPVSGGEVVYSNAPTPSAVSSVSDGYFAFSTYGYGHGVGMSQNGANFYAIHAGWNYQDILFHYYPGTTLMNTGSAETESVTVQGVPGNVLMQVAEIVNREIGPSFHTEAIKAQAVAVYTYMKYHGNDAADLKGKPNPPQSLIDACASVLGEALFYNGNYALTMFYASSGGITANCSDVFNQDIPYLRSVSGDYDAAYDPHYGDVVYFSVDELRAKLQNAYGIRLSSNPANWVKIVEGNGGYVNRVIIDGQVTVRGNAFRAVLGLKSPKFTYICSVSDQITASGPSIEDPTMSPTEAATSASAASAEAATTAASVLEATEARISVAEIQPATTPSAPAVIETVADPIPEPATEPAEVNEPAPPVDDVEVPDASDDTVMIEPEEPDLTLPME